MSRRSVRIGDKLHYNDIIEYFKTRSVKHYMLSKVEVAFLLYVENGEICKTEDVEGKVGEVTIGSLFKEEREYIAIVHTHLLSRETLSFMDLAVAADNNVNNMVIITKDKVICYEFNFEGTDGYGLTDIIMGTPVLVDTEENVQLLYDYIHEWFEVLLIGKGEQVL